MDGVNINIRDQELQELTAKAWKYDRLKKILSSYVNDPDDEVEVVELGVKAGSDDTLDELMDVAHVDGLDEFREKLERMEELFGSAEECTGDANPEKVSRCETQKVYDEIEELKKSNEFTVPGYWDCKCERNYIHPKSQKACLKCGTKFSDDDPDIPDAHRVEVIHYLEQRLSMARRLAAMDILMRQLSDEDAIEPWLSDGLPDEDDPFDVLNPDKAKEVADTYLEYADNVSDEEYKDMVWMFARTICDQCRTKEEAAHAFF